MFVTGLQRTTAVVAMLLGAVSATGAALSQEPSAPLSVTMTAEAFAASERQQRSVEEVIDLYAPHIVERRLTKEEKASIPGLLQQALEFPDWSNVEPLMLLGESGDKEAMLAVLQALKGKSSSSNYTTIYNAPFETWSPRPAEPGISARWGAEYWRRYGKHPLAFNGIFNCADAGLLVVYDCGIGVAFDEKQRKQAWKYHDGESGRPPKFKLNIGPAYHGEGAMRERFDMVLREYGPNAGRPQHREWLQGYAASHPEVAPLLQASVTAAEQEAAAAARARLERLAYYRAENLKTWQSLWAQGSLSPEDISRLEGLSAILGDDYLVQFASRYRVVATSNVEKLCQLGHSSCTQNKAQIAQDHADVDRQMQEMQAAKAEALAAARSAPGLVAVRVYDQNGGYLGDRLMTRTQAEIIGAK